MVRQQHIRMERMSSVSTLTIPYSLMHSHQHHGTEAVWPCECGYSRQHGAGGSRPNHEHHPVQPFNVLPWVPGEVELTHSKYLRFLCIYVSPISKQRLCCLNVPLSCNKVQWCELLHAHIPEEGLCDHHCDEDMQYICCVISV